MRQFADDPLGAILEVLRADGTPMRTGEIHAALVAAGVDEREVKAKWRSMPGKLRSHEQVCFKLGKYQWAGAATATDGAKPRATGRAAAIEEAERHRHLEAKIRGEFMRALAELSMDLEELIGNEASAFALIERIRTSTQAHGLEPIGDVGEKTAFDGRIHHPIAGSPDPMTSVIVMRPGYSWRFGKDEVLMAKARVIGE